MFSSQPLRGRITRCDSKARSRDWTASTDKLFNLSAVWAPLPPLRHGQPRAAARSGLPSAPSGIELQRVALDAGRLGDATRPIDGQRAEVSTHLVFATAQVD